MASRKKKTAETEVPETEVEKVADQPEVKEDFVEYVVTDCNRLNVRKHPVKDAEVLFIITRGTRVLVNTAEKIDHWYAIDVPKYGKGYAMKNYLVPIK